MTRRATRGATTGQWLAGLVLSAGAAAGLWYAWQNRATLTARRPAAASAPAGAGTATPSPARKDVAAKPAVVEINDIVRGASPLRDAQFGVGVPAGPLGLVRTVEMFQWEERCTNGRCGYVKAWSGEPVDSAAFRERKGHENTARFPFRSETFAAKEFRIGNLALDAAFAARIPAASAASTPMPVRIAQLPPNLAATFRERDGVLYAGDPARPAVGDLRVRYSTLEPNAPQRLKGVQDGDRLKPVPP